jgi:hypothetical protein
MNATGYARSQFESAFGNIDLCMQGLDDSTYNWQPSGTCNPISKLHVHILSSLDYFTSSVLQGDRSKWPQVAEQVGLPVNPQEMWQADVQVPMAPLVEYGKDVRARVLAYIDSLSDAELDREQDTKILGVKSVGWVLQFCGMHASSHAGEISAVKGMQGLKGLPF